jgi:hypothetical protein
VAEYRYHFFDLSTGTYIDVLPVEDVTFTAELRGVGTLTGNIPLYADGLDGTRVMDATIPDRTKIFVERDQALVWGGRLVPPRSYDASTGRLTINAEESLGAFAFRFLPSLSYVGVDQLDIARSLITELQSDVGGDMGIEFGSELSGVLRDRTYAAYDRTVGLTALTDLSEVIDGFEFATQTGWGDDGQPQEKLLLGYPRMGRVGTASGLVFEYNRSGSAQGNITTYTWEDGGGLYTRSWASTETEDSVQMVASSQNDDLIAAGYPLLEESAQFDGITDLSTLEAHAAAMSLFSGGHHVTAAITVKAQPGVELGDWVLGDDVLVRIADARFPPGPTGVPGFADYLRIVGASVKPGVEGDEEYTFTMGDFLEGI